MFLFLKQIGFKREFNLFVMIRSMLTVSWKKIKVFRPIIIFYFINMVNGFASFEESTERFFGNKNMFKYVASRISSGMMWLMKVYIFFTSSHYSPSPSRAFRAFESFKISIKTFARTVFAIPSFVLAGLYFKTFATSLTNFRDFCSKTLPRAILTTATFYITWFSFKILSASLTLSNHVIALLSNCRNITMKTINNQQNLCH